MAFCINSPNRESIGESVPLDEDITDINLSILLVDDDYIMHKVTTLMLNELGIQKVYSAMSGSQGLAMLESNVLLAQRLNMKIVAEGVETQKDWDLISELSCDQVQGYYIAKPMPADQLCEWLKNWQFGLTQQLEVVRY